MNNFAMQAQRYMQGIMSNQKMINSNPMLRNMTEMYNGHNSKGLEEMARNLCREKGIDADKIYKDICQRMSN